MSIEAMKQALDALVRADRISGHPNNGKTITALRVAIAEATEQKQGMKFNLGDTVRKVSGSQWKGTVVGTYSTELTPEGYAVESSTERGSVQIYPAKALELVASAVDGAMQRLTDVQQEMEYRLSSEQYQNIGIFVEGLLRAGAKITAIDPKTCLRAMPGGSINCGFDIRYGDSPSREWVGLTDEEIEDCWDGYLSDYQLEMICAIESKLKEKNS